MYESSIDDGAKVGLLNSALGSIRLPDCGGVVASGGAIAYRRFSEPDDFRPSRCRLIVFKYRLYVIIELLYLSSTTLR